MLLTPRLCIDRGWQAALSCGACRITRAVYGFPATPPAMLDTPVDELWRGGRFKCRRCRAVAASLTITEERVGREIEIARWPKKDPAC
ncbi:MAG TPA: hypothetical protein VMU59_09225 [Caulobacteraceae bacterium]|nr:hypothetical protein [Caulobacteraceae bacterium]